jgi:GT2 family glycosyltransferase
MPKVVVSLVTHNESHDVERLLPSVFRQTFRDLHVVAVDNASEDGTRAALASFEKVTPVPMTVVPSRENLGYTGGHNVGIS